LPKLPDLTKLDPQGQVLRGCRAHKTDWRAAHPSELIGWVNGSLALLIGAGDVSLFARRIPNVDFLDAIENPDDRSAGLEFVLSFERYIIMRLTS